MRGGSSQKLVYSNVKTKLTSSKKKLASSPKIIERIHFKYFKFYCKNLTQTIDFYQTLGMTLDYKIPHNTASNYKTILAFSYSTAIKNIYNDNNDSGRKRGSFINFDCTSDQVVPQLVFEYDNILDPEKAFKDNKDKNDVNTAVAAHNYEYLVIYVHFISRLVKKIEAKGIFLECFS